MLKDTLYKCLDDKQGQNITTIDFKGTHALMDYMLVCEASNSRLMHALVEELKDTCDKLGYDEYHVEGNGDSDWLLFYCDHVAVSVFLKESRAFYNLDKLWYDYIVHE